MESAAEADLCTPTYFPACTKPNEGLRKRRSLHTCCALASSQRRMGHLLGSQASHLMARWQGHTSRRVFAIFNATKCQRTMTILQSLFSLNRWKCALTQHVPTHWSKAEADCKEAASCVRCQAIVSRPSHHWRDWRQDGSNLCAQTRQCAMCSAMEYRSIHMWVYLNARFHCCSNCGRKELHIALPPPLNTRCECCGSFTQDTPI